MEPETSASELQGRLSEASNPLIDEFSLLHGGLVYRLQTLIHGFRPSRHQFVRRALFLVIITWLPLLILSLIDHEAWDSRLTIPLLRDWGVNVRFLITLPLLVFAESVIDPRLRDAVRHFVVSGLVDRDQLPAFEKLIVTINRLRDSWMTFAVLIAIAFAPTVITGGREILSAGPLTWHTTADATGETLSRAGWWFALISVPIGRLIIWRWTWVIVLWTIFLTRVVGLNLNCIPTHPDKAGGLGFLAEAQQFFGFISFASTAVIAGGLANELAYRGATIPGLRNIMIAACLLNLLFAMAPLLVVTKKLFETRERGLFEYASLGCVYVSDFDRKWLRSVPAPNEPLLGTADIQSLADLSNSFSVISDMKYVLIDKELLLALAIPTAAPMVVLLLAFSPGKEVIEAILKLVMG